MPDTIANNGTAVPDMSRAAAPAGVAFDACPPVLEYTCVFSTSTRTFSPDATSRVIFTTPARVQSAVAIIPAR